MLMNDVQKSPIVVVGANVASPSKPSDALSLLAHEVRTPTLVILKGRKGPSEFKLDLSSQTAQRLTLASFETYNDDNSSDYTANE